MKNQQSQVQGKERDPQEQAQGQVLDLCAEAGAKAVYQSDEDETMILRRLSETSIGGLESLSGHLERTDEARVEHDERHKWTYVSK